MKKNFILNSRSYGLLFILCMLFISACKRHYKPTNLENVSTNAIDTNETSLIDSISITLHKKNKVYTGFNIINNLLDYNGLDFFNDNLNDTIITRKISRVYENQLIIFFNSTEENGRIKDYRHYYLIDKGVHSLDFKYKKGNVFLKNKDSSIITDKLFNDYNQIVLQIKRSKENKKKDFEKRLSNLHEFYKKKYELESDNIKAQLNDNHYIFALQNIYPSDDRIDQFLKKIKTIVAGEPLNMLVYLYVKNKIDTLNFKTLDTIKYSSKYINLVATGVFKNLRENKDATYFNEAYNWLKSTETYRNNAIKIDLDLISFDKEEFTRKLKELSILDMSFTEKPFFKKDEKRSSDFYLIDFWATWCVPCIEGIKAIQKFDLPKNLKVINLSVDKMNVKEKWKARSIELGMEKSFLINKTPENIEFIKMIELNTLPRYIIIDKDYKLIDINFLHPHEKDFLKKLNQLK